MIFHAVQPFHTEVKPVTGPLSVVVPARNEAATIAQVVGQLLPQPWVGEVVVVDNGSHDETATIAQEAGARIVHEARAGMGHALRAGLAAARHDWVMKVDADLGLFEIDRFAAMAEARGPGIGLVKGNWFEAANTMPMTRFVVMPALAQLAPGLRTLRAPNSGIYVLDRRWIAHQEIVGSYAADLDVMLRVHCSGARVVEVDIGEIAHDARNVGHYNTMAETIMAFFMERMDKRVTHETVVMAHDAGAVMTAALGLLAARARAGSRVLIYLAEAQGPEADILRAALAAFPNAYVLPLGEIVDYAPCCATGHVRIIAPFPSAERSEVLRAALGLHADLLARGLSPLELLMMPAVGRVDVVQSFRADFGFDVSEGAAIKRQALTQAAGQDKDATPEGDGEMPREVFQSFASLPHALKMGLTPKPLRAEASQPG